MTRRGRTLPSKDVSRRIEEVGSALRESMTALAAAAGSTGSPSPLIRRLGIDKSLAGRLLRALRAETQDELVHWTPSPQGLRIVLQHAAASGIDPEIVKRAESAVALFQDLIDSVDGGRAVLDGFIAGRQAEVLRRREETSKQAVYRAMSFLLGYSCDISVSAQIVGPSEDGRSLDLIELHHRQGLRRVRANRPLLLHSFRFPDIRPDGPSIVTLDGKLAAEDPLGLFLRRFSDPATTPLEIVEDGPATIFVLPEGDPTETAPLQVTTGFRVVRGHVLPSADGIRYLGRAYLLVYPCRQLIRDMFFAESIFGSEVPKIVTEIPPVGDPGVRNKGRMAEIVSLDLDTPLRQLRRDLSDVRIENAPRYEEIIRFGFERSGWNPAGFKGYRCSVSYPTPFLMTKLWICPPGMADPDF